MIQMDLPLHSLHAIPHVPDQLLLGPDDKDNLYKRSFPCIELEKPVKAPSSKLF